jgi:hypothetical protein
MPDVSDITSSAVQLARDDRRRRRQAQAREVEGAMTLSFNKFC